MGRTAQGGGSGGGELRCSVSNLGGGSGAEMVRDGSLQLPLFELLGLYLAFCYQKSGGSLPFVVVTHATFNAVVTALRAAQVGSTLPF